MGFNQDGQSQIIGNSGSKANVGALKCAGTAEFDGAISYNGVTPPAKISIALAASATTDGMDITFTMQDEAGNAVAGGYLFDWWISESAVGAGLTGDTYSGDVTMPTTGTEIAENVSKKAFTALTAANGTAVALAVDSGNPADQYVCAQLGNRRFVSAVSGTNWEGAA